jgi:hypothetical protein
MGYLSRDIIIVFAMIMKIITFLKMLVEMILLQTLWIFMMNIGFLLLTMRVISLRLGTFSMPLDTFLDLKVESLFENFFEIIFDSEVTLERSRFDC